MAQFYIRQWIPGGSLHITKDPAFLPCSIDAATVIELDEAIVQTMYIAQRNKDVNTICNCDNSLAEVE